jgi:hypothetical protein
MIFIKNILVKKFEIHLFALYLCAVIFNNSFTGKSLPQKIFVKIIHLSRKQKPSNTANVNFIA